MYFIDVHFTSFTVNINVTQSKTEIKKTMNCAASTMQDQPEK